MKFNLYVQDNCDFCNQVEIPEGINVEMIYINRDGFVGFKPGNVPVIQHEGMNFEGPHGINALLQLAKDAQDGKYKKQ